MGVDEAGEEEAPFAVDHLVERPPCPPTGEDRFVPSPLDHHVGMGDDPVRRTLHHRRPPDEDTHEMQYTDLRPFPASLAMIGP
ncbi:MAG: hypothetical protein Kow0097_13960 [Candidatus Bipolaricaulota bacterium]